MGAGWQAGSPIFKPKNFQIVANIQEILLTRKRDGSTFAVEFAPYTNWTNEPHYRLAFQGAPCRIEKTDQGPAVYFDKYTMKEHHVTIGTAFGFKWDRKSNINILIQDATPFDAVWQVWKDECAAAKSKRVELENSQPKILVAWDFLDWGDYNITQERRIIELRAALPGETSGWHQHRIVANLDDKRIGDLSEKWTALVKVGKKADMVGINGDTVNIVEIAAEQAAPFLNQIEQFEASEAQKQAEANARAEAARIREKEIQDNIAAGAVYFRCESAPHDEDLSGMILNRPASNGGLFVLQYRISENLFNRIRSFGRYWDRDWLEECDMFTSAPGWRFSIAAVNELARTNRVFVDGKEYSV